MRVAFIGGTNFVGPVAVALLMRAGHAVAVAHSGEHEHPAVSAAEHLHGEREELLGGGGAGRALEADVITDTFARAATAEAAEATKDCASRA